MQRQDILYAIKSRGCDVWHAPGECGEIREFDQLQAQVFIDFLSIAEGIKECVEADGIPAVVEVYRLQRLEGKDLREALAPDDEDPTE